MLVSLCFDSVVLCLIFQIAFENISSMFKSEVRLHGLLVVSPRT